MSRRTTVVLTAVSAISLLLASYAQVSAGQDQLGDEPPAEDGDTGSLLAESDPDAIHARLRQDATRDRTRIHPADIGGLSAAQCSEHRTDDVFPDDGDMTLDIHDAFVFSGDCVTPRFQALRFLIRFSSGDLEPSLFSFAEIGLTANDPPDNSLGCGGDEFEILIGHDSQGFFGSVYFVPFPTCDIDNFVWLDTVDVKKVDSTIVFEALQVDLFLPVIGQPSTIHWWAWVLDTDDGFFGPGTDSLMDDGHRIREDLEIGGLDAVLRWFVSNNLRGGRAEFTVDFAEVFDFDLYIGDWDGDGEDGIGRRRGRTFTLLDDIASSGAATASTTKVVSYGRPGDQALIGDWDGDGDDTITVRRGNLFYVANRIKAGPADKVISYGKPGDQVFVGDWDGDGDDTLAVRRGNVFFVKNSLRSGRASTVFGYGKATDTVLVGDWDGDGIDTFAVRRGNKIFIRNDFRSMPAEISFSYGRTTDGLGAGDWDGDGVDTFIVVRALIE